MQLESLRGNYLERYHLPAAHPSLFRELNYAQYRVETFRYYSQIAPIRAGFCRWGPTER